MRILAGLCLLAIVVIATAATRDSLKLPSEVLARVPARYDIHARKNREAKRELQELVKNCGAGVVQGAVRSDGRASENRCSFQVKLDELFFRSEEEKTGLIEDTEWAYGSDVVFYEPSATVAVPDAFDVRDLMKNGQPDLRTQKCGDCWAWATHHGLELARAVHDQKVYDHSIQTVLSCSKAGTCGGGYMSAVDFLKYGLPYENEFPYKNGVTGTCKYNSSQIQSGWDGKVIGTPYVGSSLMYSRALRTDDGGYEQREGNKVKNMMAAIYQWKAPLVVTVAGYSISGNGIYNSCSSINSGGNHMVAISGWDTVDGKRIAHVWNSWGKGHGKDGVSRIQWECGDGKLNRGLGVSAKIVQYKAPCVAPDAKQPHLHQIVAGDSVRVGAEQPPGTKCTWAPTDGLSDPSACVTSARPNMSTEYHLTAKNDCGSSSSMTMVTVWGGQRGEKGKRVVLTPYGETEL